MALAPGAAKGFPGFSVRLHIEHWGATIGEVDIPELSLTPEPADSGAVVPAVADEACRLWMFRDAVSGVLRAGG